MRALLNILFHTILVIYISVYSYPILSLEDNQISLKKSCLHDLDFIYKNIINNSAQYKNEENFYKWVNEGYKESCKLIQEINKLYDCHYIITYYIYGFKDTSIDIKPLIDLPPVEYPAILSILQNNEHIIFYKENNISSLKNISIGDKITHINEIPVSEYFKEYIVPFYTKNYFYDSLVKSSVYLLINDANRFIIKPKIITYIHNNISNKLVLNYTIFTKEALNSTYEILKQFNNNFSIELIKKSIWIKIPSFIKTNENYLFFEKMLSNLKLYSQDKNYIIFDVRNNKGGDYNLARAIIRNLWGDHFIRNQVKNHDYNKTIVQKIALSKENFLNFKQKNSMKVNKSYLECLTKNEDFYYKEWCIYDEKENLYSNTNNKPVNATIIVLTNNICDNACWHFINEIRQIPNVIHIGISPIILNNVYSNIQHKTTPSQKYELFFPIEINVANLYNKGNSLVPHIYIDSSEFNKSNTELFNIIKSTIEK